MPFQGVLRDGSVYGRGTEDNGQSIISSMFASRSFLNEDLQGMSIGVAYVADEETGSIKGIKHLLDMGCFSKDDVIMVPDSCSEDGTEIEIGEKTSPYDLYRDLGTAVACIASGYVLHQGYDIIRIVSRKKTDIHAELVMTGYYVDPVDGSRPLGGFKGRCPVVEEQIPIWEALRKGLHEIGQQQRGHSVCIDTFFRSGSVGGLPFDDET